MTNIDIVQLLKHPERLNNDTLYELRTLVQLYPYFLALRFLYLKNLYLLHDASFGTELRKAIPHVPDRSVLSYWIEGRLVIPPVAVPSKVETEDTSSAPVEDRTLALINSFLLEQPMDEVRAIQQLDYSTDYAAYLLEQSEDIQPLIKEESAPMSYEEETATSASSDEAEDDSSFTETLAKIYIRQKRYEKALEIIRKLNLKYPKKNAYFADQIRFLEKLIINNKSNK